MWNRKLETALTDEHRDLRRWFAKRGLELQRVWKPIAGDLELQRWQLHQLKAWVEVWEEMGDREEMEHLGFCFPPIGVGLDPDTDWRRFEGWMATTWEPRRMER